MTTTSNNIPTVTGTPVINDNEYEIHITMVEVEEVSPVGWMCLIFGCFFCPGFNLLGLCMTERRLVPRGVALP